MKNWNMIAGDEMIEKTVVSLKANGIKAEVVENRDEAKRKVLELIPGGSEVMTMTSATLDTIGLTDEINMNGKFNPVRDRLYSMDKEREAQEMNRLGAAPEFAVGSVHAITQDGHVLIASATGSQLPAYAYSAGKVVWVAGTQKLVKDTEEGIKRIYEYVLPLEDKRAQKAYGVGSGVNKLLIFNKEVNPERITLILVREPLGF